VWPRGWGLREEGERKQLSFWFSLWEKIIFVGGGQKTESSGRSVDTLDSQKGEKREGGKKGGGVDERDPVACKKREGKKEVKQREETCHMAERATRGL